jgi:hypothetical protein
VVVLAGRKMLAANDSDARAWRMTQS